MKSFVGRAEEVGAVAEAVSAAHRRRGALFLVVGEPGIGKSRLAEEAADRSGLRTAWGRCWEAGGAPPYWPWIEAVRPLVDAAPAAADLRELLPWPGEAPVAVLDPSEARFRLFARVGAWLRDLPEPLVLVLDDLHVADVPSLLLLELVARSVLRTAPVVLLGTMREGEAVPEAAACLARIAREGHVLRPRRLDAAEVALLVDDRGVDTARVHEVSEGLPLLVGEVAELVRSGERRLPAGGRELTRARVGRLPDATRRTLSRASVLGRDLDGGVLAELAEVPETTLVDTLAPAVEARVVTAAERGWRFTHVLVPEVLEADLPAGERAALHLRAARAWERLHPGEPAAGFRHLARAAALLDPTEVVEAGLRAARQAMAELGFEEGRAVLEWTRALLARVAPGLAGDVLLELGVARMRSGDAEGGRAACEEASAVARRTGDPLLLGRAALARVTGVQVGVVDPRRVFALEEALAALPPGHAPLRARLLASLAAARQPAPDPWGPVGIAREAIALARATGDDEVLRAVIHTAMAALIEVDDPDFRFGLNVEVLALAVARRDRLQSARTRARLVVDCCERVDLAGMEEHGRAYAAEVAGLGHRRDLPPPELVHAMFLHAAGRFAEADQVAGAAGATHGEYRFADRIWRDADAPADEDVRAAYQRYANGAQMNDAMRALLAARSGDATGVRARLECLDDAASLWYCALAYGEAAASIRDRARCERVLPDLEGNRGRLQGHGLAGLVPIGHGSRFLGLVFAALGRTAEAAELLREAVWSCEHAGVRPELARAWADLASVEQGRGDERTAEELRARARSLATRLGMAGLARRIDGRPPPPGPEVRAAEPAGPSFRLTPSEDGRSWTVTSAEGTTTYKDSKGLRWLSELLAHPDREFHVLELVGGPQESGDGGEILDAAAVKAYRERALELQEELEDAEARGDLGRTGRLQEQLELLRTEVSRAMAMSGRRRTFGGEAEKARVNVQRRIRDARDRIAADHPELGRHLDWTVETGFKCVYRPGGRR